MATVMAPVENTGLPDPQVCEQARLSRDARFDGLFFTAVSSTGIYCRPVCPAPAPKRANVCYFRHAAAAEAAGYRPCLRCRPELSPEDGNWRRGDAVLARALKLIDEGFLADACMGALAARVHVSERHLRRLFSDSVGAPPVGVHGTRRLLFAKQLLTETRLPITEVALAAGFNSLRRFNAAFVQAYRMAPRDLRRDSPPQRHQALVLRLGYRPPFDFAATLHFLRPRALPGVERVDPASYSRTLGTSERPGFLRLSAWPGDSHALKLELENVAASELQATVQRVRRMFDLDADPRPIAEALSADASLRQLLRKRPGLRLPGSWDGFEIAVRAVLGQQVSVAAATTLARRLIDGFGTVLPEPQARSGLDRLFPTPTMLAEADAGTIGLTRARAGSLRTLARALEDGTIDFRPDHSLDEVIEAWTALPGIGPWTAHYIALRALAHPDAFPSGDLILRRALSGADKTLTATQLARHAEAWRPWRAYAAIQIWRQYVSSSREGSCS